MKTCKQCGESLTETMFRSYYPRGKGIHKSKVGLNTVCIPCERINASINKAWKSGTNPELLTQATDYYNMLVENGLEPIGPFARHLRGAPPIRQTGAEYSQNKMAEVMSKLAVNGDAISDEYNRLLGLELTDEPDVYQSMLEDVRDKSLGKDGKVQPRYIDQFNAVAIKFDEYEDNYRWD